MPDWILAPICAVALVGFIWFAFRQGFKTKPNKDMPNQAPARTGPRSVSFTGTFLAAILFLSLSLAARADSPKQNLDFSNYDVPLYEQITNRIKAKILARLGDGRSTRDRYFIIPFAYQNKGNVVEARRCYRECTKHATRGEVRECTFLLP